jgi:hypothetical protein
VPEELGGRTHRRRDRNRGLIEEDADLALLRHIVEGAREASARRILHRHNPVAGGGEDRPHQASKRSDVGTDLVFELQAMAGGENGEP